MGDRRAVQRDEGAVFTFAPAMNCARRDLFTDSALSKQEEVRATRRRLTEREERLIHLWVFAPDERIAVAQGLPTRGLSPKETLIALSATERLRGERTDRGERLQILLQRPCGARRDDVCEQSHRKATHVPTCRSVPSMTRTPLDL